MNRLLQTVSGKDFLLNEANYSIIRYAFKLGRLYHISALQIREYGTVESQWSQILSENSQLHDLINAMNKQQETQSQSADADARIFVSIHKKFEEFPSSKSYRDIRL